MPNADALAHSAKLAQHIAQEIETAGGWISFARYMELALYAPGLGYYSAGSRKFGAEGDFITAPELGALFGKTLARQVAQVLRQTGGAVLELGAGSGKLAATLLSELAALEQMPARYLILEPSADLQQRQRAWLTQAMPAFVERVQWLDTLPEAFTGVVLANEVLDALPAHVIRAHDNDNGVNNNGVDKLGVIVRDGTFAWQARPAHGLLLSAAQALQLAPGYTTEISFDAPALARSLGDILEHGVIFFIDYGFPAHEYYHPQRNAGTLMCHYRQHAHGDPFLYVGLQDITTHVDFSAIANAGLDAGLDVLGYANQARFLINCGITAFLEKIPVENSKAYLPAAAEAQKLLSPAEMGELFKVLALGKNFAEPLIGFASGNRAHTL